MYIYVNRTTKYKCFRHDLIVSKLTLYVFVIWPETCKHACMPHCVDSGCRNLSYERQWPNFMSHRQHHSCWWTGYVRSQGISSYSIDLVFLNISLSAPGRLRYMHIYGCKLQVRNDALYVVTLHFTHTTPLLGANNISVIQLINFHAMMIMGHSPVWYMRLKSHEIYFPQTRLSLFN